VYLKIKKNVEFCFDNFSMYTPKFVIEFSHPSIAGVMKLDSIDENTQLEEILSGNDYGGLWYNRKLSGFTVYRSQHPGVYDFLMWIENNLSERCKSLSIVLKHYTSPTNAIVRYTGEVNLNQCKFSLDRCRIELESTQQNIYSHIDRKKDVEFNLLSVGNAFSVFLIEPSMSFTSYTSVNGWVEMVSATDYPNPSSPPPGDHWSLYQINSGYWLWMRLFTVNECLGGNSVMPGPFLVDGYYNSWDIEQECVALNAFVKMSKWVTFMHPFVSNTLEDYLIHHYECPHPYAIGEVNTSGTCTSIACDKNHYDREYSNARRLSDVLRELITFLTEDALIQVAGVKSNFFGINSDGDPNVNPYTGGYNFWRDPALMDITDVKWPDASNDATISIITFKKIMGDLYKKFRVRWNIQELSPGTFTLIIEHEKHILAQMGLLDLTDDDGFREYTYSSSELSGRITYTDIVQRNIDFVGTSITFELACTENSEDKYNTELLCSDVQFIRDYPDDCPNDGVVILSVVEKDGKNIIWRRPGALSGLWMVNTPMSWANCLETFHNYEGNTKTGYINGHEVTFEIVKRVKEQKIDKLDCAYNGVPTVRCKTSLGNEGILQSVRTNLKSNELNFTIRL
jgi:hypothetical protein